MFMVNTGVKIGGYIKKNHTYTTQSLFNFWMISTTCKNILSHVIPSLPAAPTLCSYSCAEFLVCFADGKDLLKLVIHKRGGLFYIRSTHLCVRRTTRKCNCLPSLSSPLLPPAPDPPVEWSGALDRAPSRVAASCFSPLYTCPARGGGE